LITTTTTITVVYNFHAS